MNCLAALPVSLTQRQREYVEFMGAFFQRNDQFPPLQTLADQFNCYPNSARCHCEALERKGVIAKNVLGKWKRGALWPL